MCAPPGAAAAADATAAAASRRGYASGSGSDSEEEENTGQWSPAALDPALVTTGQDVVHEDDDARSLDLMRAHVRGLDNAAAYWAFTCKELQPPDAAAGVAVVAHRHALEQRAEVQTCTSESHSAGCIKMQ